MEESHVRKAYALLTNSLSKLGELVEALKVCREGILLHKLGELLPSVESYRRVLEVQETRHFTSVDPSIGNVKARHNLALVYEELGRFDLAELHWRLALERSAEFVPAYRAIFGVLLKQGKMVTCERLIQNWRASTHVEDLVDLLDAELAVAKGDIEDARQKYDALIEERTEDGQVLQSASQFYFQHGKLVEAESVLRRLVAIRPEDAAAHYNLAALCLQLGEFAEATRSIDKSLRLRPDSAVARLLKVQLTNQQSLSHAAARTLE